MRVAKETRLLLTIGGCGATNLPMLVTESVLSRQGMLVDINPSNAFSELAYIKKRLCDRAKTAIPCRIRGVIQILKNRSCL